MESGYDKWTPRRILVGYDGSAGGNDAVALARNLAAEDSEVVLAHVVGAFPVPTARLREDEIRDPDGIFPAALRQLAPRSAEARAYVGRSVAKVLTEIAGEEDFDLVVIGAGHHGTVARTFLGSVAHGLLYGAPRPVATAPRGFAGRPPRAVEAIAVAYDGTPEAEAALGYAESLAREVGGRLRLLTVAAIPTTPAMMLGYTPPMPKPPAEVLAEGAATVDPEIDADTRLLDGGSIPASLSRVCGEQVDLLVVGSRGYGAFSRVMIGSVAAGLVHRARCPVLVVPRPRREELEPDWRLREPRRDVIPVVAVAHEDVAY